MECICSVWRVGETPDPGAPRLPIAHSCWDHGRAPWSAEGAMGKGFRPHIMLKSVNFNHLFSQPLEHM